MLENLRCCGGEFYTAKKREEQGESPQGRVCHFSSPGLEKFYRREKFLEKLRKPLQASPPPYLCSVKTPISAVAGDCIKTRCSTKDWQLRKRNTTDFHGGHPGRRDLQRGKNFGGPGMWAGLET